MNGDDPNWADHFRIQSMFDLDFVIGQSVGLPVGMERTSPPEFRRRVLAAAISYQLSLQSIDYTLKRYVEPDTYEKPNTSLGDEVSGYLRGCISILEEELRALHSRGDLAFGVFGAEITLFRVPYALNTARTLSDRGQLLEVLPILRLCLEMMAWASVAFGMEDEDKVIALKAQNCIAHLKKTYKTAGKLYGYLSSFTHWGHVVHGQFLHIGESQIGILKASVRYRAMALALCLIILDVLIVVVRSIYSERSDRLVQEIQGTLMRDSTRSTFQHLERIVDFCPLKELQDIQALVG